MDVAIAIIIALIIVGVIAFIVASRRKELPPPSAREALPAGAEEKPPLETPGPSDEHDERPAAAETKSESETAQKQEPAAKPEEPAPPVDVDVKTPGTGESQRRETASTAPADAQISAAREEELKALKKGLETTRGGFISRLAKLFSGKRQIDETLLEEIEEVLITADIGVKTTQKILETLRTKMQNGELPDEDSVWNALRAQTREILTLSTGPMAMSGQPAVMLVVGVNGVGKTTTIGKLASRYEKQGKKVLLAAGDTFRAAAVLQLEVWGRRVGCPVVKGKENADPGSVIFDAIKKASQEGYDIVIADTAGRLHTKIPLMEELKKVSRTVTKALDDRPADQILLVLDSTIGQNAVQQARMFRDALDISGFVLTKLDGTAKGGVILSVVDEHQIPVRYIGLGERVEDLREFEVENFVDALFARPDDDTLAA